MKNLVQDLWKFVTATLTQEMNHTAESQLFVELVHKLTSLLLLLYNLTVTAVSAAADDNDCADGDHRLRIRGFCF